MNLLCAAVILAATPYEIEGDVIQVIKDTPFTVKMTAGGDLFFWSVPTGVEYEESGGSIKITKAPQGELQITVKVVSIDWDNKMVNQTSHTIPLLIGQLPQPPPDPDNPDPPSPTGCESKSTEQARSVCTWLKLVPERSRGASSDLSSMFSELAAGLESGRFVNYSQSNEWFYQQRDKILGTQDLKDDWAKFGGRLSQAISGLKEEPRPVIVQFYRDVSEGLK